MDNETPDVKPLPGLQVLVIEDDHVVEVTEHDAYLEWGADGQVVFKWPGADDYYAARAAERGEGWAY